MSNAITSATNPLTDLIHTLTKKYDRTGDAPLSSQAFGTVLTDLVRDGGRTNSTFASGTAAQATSVPAGRLEGVDHGKLADASLQTLKYQVGRVLEQNPNTPQGLTDALPAIQQLVPGVRITGTHGDTLDFGGVVDSKGVEKGDIAIAR